MAISD